MIDRDALLGAIARLTAAMEREAPALNEIDGALGDGDLGITMTRGMQAVASGAAEMPADLGQALLRCAQAFTKTSGSSYGTLFATGLMSAAKALKGRESLDASEVSGLIAGARDAMQQRGKAEIGGKTVLDSLDAMAKATVGLSDPAEVARAARNAAQEAMEAFREKPATVGRARIFADKSRTMLDPGMLAMTRIVEAVTGEA
ncbi:Putative dihydroxyacetone kinase, ADP-binding protein subunit [Rubellimicrobium mesophilum DSM 19309]|uniref:Putative dihydroxyacetone kinase, ADP-binding protein subunit n=1 Tax=Rubellimicrobium mesophilum DSM 19309 TaxID=442562 RepID=A0A017HMN1_9RHOB|nr:dihydroxyacetone kinase subunit L [Rubellimicrobium mesophilum]EYD75545.1 Putative dihydroxyacetone kinase, ADP-binding protein subunit [Rubellimicrobium mesophilum DSM 19309]